MKILAFTDFHGNEEAYRRAKELAADEKPDLLIVAGDIINYDFNRAKQHLSDLASGGRPVYFVPGNMDSEELGGWAGAENIHALHGRCEYSEEDAARLLEAAAKDCRGDRLILASHCPPKNTKVDQLASGEHAKHIGTKFR